MPTSSGAGAGPGCQDGQKHGPHIASPRGRRAGADARTDCHATVADMTLQSPAIVASVGSPGSPLLRLHLRRRGKWPALHWSGVPSGTAELVLFAMNVQPVEGRTLLRLGRGGPRSGPRKHRSRQAPEGAVVGTNGFGKRGYSICPAGAGETYMFALYALPQGLSPAKGFDPLALRKQVLAASGNVGFLARRLRTRLSRTKASSQYQSNTRQE